MRRLFKVLPAVVLTSALVSQNVWAQTTDLEQRLNDLEQQIAVLKRQIENNKEDTATKAKDAPVITANAKDGFSIKSADDAFKLRVRGLVQADARIFTGDYNKDLAGTTDTFLVRRARPIFEGTVGKNFDFYLMPDLAVNAAASSNAQLVDAYVDFKLKPWLKVRGGKFKAPFGLERLQSDAVANFIETGLPSNLVPNRDVGFQVFGDLFNDRLSYQVGIFNGGPDLASVDTSDTNNDKDVIGRIFAHPFKDSDSVLKGLGLGIAGSYGHREGTGLPTYRSPGQASIFSYSATGLVADGAHTRVSPQAYFYKGSAGLLGEYVQSTQELVRGAGISETVTNKAWQLSGNYVLTGELASYKGITPRTNFDLEKGTWGAFEVVGRYGVLDLDNSIFDAGFGTLTAATGVSKEVAWGAGLNWYPHKNVRVGVDYEHTEFERGATAGADRPAEHVVLTRLQLQY